ncbi:hypothetical protein EZJ43_11605 [Pedobacter changchengzhani]|uniref:Uncharacterized protein n=1 Tax=Pedobacter changchengzhani TaxID=2529274 RepID=A0A4R5MJB1_9SPHI|nr:hypothetical protein [Pedobacter changchengzhani]TDG35661.1 hypothetical protein EZJ43_11605 [Pedobacter changchengzhani]
MGSFLSLYLVYILIRIGNKFLDKDHTKDLKDESLYDGQKNLLNFYPLVFHIVITFLIIFSSFSPSLLNGEKIHALVADGIFQFVSTALIFLISLINPFQSFSPETRTKLEAWDVKDKAFVEWLLKGRNWQLVKLALCLLLITYFIYSGYLVLPKLNNGLVSDVAIVLISIFIFGNVLQLIRNPVNFKHATLFRLSMLYRSIKKSLIISGAIILAVLLFTTLLKIDTEKLVNLEGIALLVYNVVMVYNEYKVLEA